MLCDFDPDFAVERPMAKNLLIDLKPGELRRNILRYIALVVTIPILISP